jgi:phytoene dehydrogenase-like protein
MRCNVDNILLALLPLVGAIQRAGVDAFVFTITTTGQQQQQQQQQQHHQRQHQHQYHHLLARTRTGPVGLAIFRRLFRKNQRNKSVPDEEEQSALLPPPKLIRKLETFDVCLVGGGVSALVASAEAATLLGNSKGGKKVVLLESNTYLGGRVHSHHTEDGYVLDRGFATFIEQFPVSQALLDYDELELGKFTPGALVKVPGRDELVRVADPLRQPGELVSTLLAPIGSLADKIALLPLILKARFTSVEHIFDEEETDTITALKERWGFDTTIIERFFKPFLEGVYLSPLEEQSSRMFMFVFKMFSQGAATLPVGGIGAVVDQLADTARRAGVDLRTGQAVGEIAVQDTKNGGFLVTTRDGNTVIQATTVICATDGPSAHKLLSHIRGLESLAVLTQPPQRSVGCLYYTFDTPVPVTEPILILNGMGEEKGGRGSDVNPVNSICFPSQVAKGYAPNGHGLCSVTIMTDAMIRYRGREQELDRAVRKQLGTWFPAYASDIQDKWEFKKFYEIPWAQPGQLNGPFPANVNGGRECTSFRGMELPSGLFVCGDHMATATLNGALESGRNAGRAAANAVRELQHIPAGRVTS